MKNIIYLLLFAALGSSLFAQTQMDALRQETGLDQVYQQYSLSGQGVALAMIERGIDYRHPDFIDANGNTRIAYLYDMVDPSGANDPDNPYGIGTIYTRSQIDAALSSGTPLATNDRYGHGTACTGIAAGDGSGMPAAPYRGVATGATLIVVKVMQDGFPATGGIPAQTAFFDPTYIPVALQFVEDKTTELGLPSVSLLNLGSIGGPTDGSSAICRAIDDFVAPGRLFVCGVGDDGGNDNRASGSVGQGMSFDLRFEKAAAGNLRFETWYSGDDRFDITLIRPDGTTAGPFSSPATNQAADQQLLADLRYYHRGADQDFDQSDNGKRQILIDFFGATGTYTVRFQGATVTDGSFSASLNPSRYYNGNRFLDAVTPGGSINDYASARQAIVPTDYVLDSTWTDIDGINRSRGNEGQVGDLWVGSSAGPTLDGRIGVDVAVPGEVLVGAYSPNSYYSQFSFNVVQNSDTLYGIQTAVSAAAPVLTGLLALMLEVKPDLSGGEAKNILQQTARSDAFTGMLPNGAWGHGKLDALAAVEATRNAMSLESQSLQAMGFSFFPNPARHEVSYQLKGHRGTVRVELLDLQARRIKTYELTGNSGSLPLPPLPKGVYLLKVKTSQQQAVGRLLIH
jgi:minor extracellular serine protease Vpr